MQEQPSAGVGRTLSADEVAALVLQVLLERQPALVAVEELVREFGHADPAQAIADFFVREAVDELVRSGLAYRLEGFVFASYSAVRAGELGG